MGGAKRKQVIDSLRSQKGFTLIEVTVGLALSLMILSATMSLQTMARANANEWKTKQQLQMESAAFLHYLENELSESSQAALAANRMLFYIGSDLYDYKQAGNIIVRRKNDLGYVTACYYVKEWSLVPLNKGVLIKLTLEKNKVVWVTQTVIAYRV